MTGIDRLAAAATGQRGFVTRRQAQAGGISDAMLRSRVQSGHLEKSGARTFTSPLLPKSSLGELTSLLLDVELPVWAFGRTAAALHGFPGFVLKPPFHLVVPRGRNIQRVGHAVHTTTNLDVIDQFTLDDIPLTTPTRTLIDIARELPPERLATAVEFGLTSGKTSEDYLHRRIAALRSSGFFGTPKLLEVIEGYERVRGVQSWLEREFLQLVATSNLPQPMSQQTLSSAAGKMVRVDFAFGRRVVVEVLGYRWHRSKVQMQRDSERLNRLLLDGYLVLQFTYEDITLRPNDVLSVLREALGRS